MEKLEDVSKKEEIYNNIKNMILSLEIKPGEKIPEQEIAKHLHISKTPVRTAIQQLAWEGLVKLEPNRSATVMIVDQSMMEELALIRLKQDELIIPLAIYNGSPRDFDELRKIANSCIDVNNKGDLKLRHKLDSDFHLKLVEIGRNKMMYRIQVQLNSIIQLWQNIYITDCSMMADGLEEHLRIVDAMEKRDQKTAIELTKKHIISSYDINFERFIDMKIGFSY